MMYVGNGTAATHTDNSLESRAQGVTQNRGRLNGNQPRVGGRQTPRGLNDTMTNPAVGTKRGDSEAGIGAGDGATAKIDGTLHA